MAEVWRAVRHAQVGDAQKVLAIKVIRANNEDERHREMFMREARVSMLLNHAAIAQVFDISVDDGRLYLVMEFIDGVDLSKLIKYCRSTEQKLGFPVIGYIIGEILRALSYAHEFRARGEQRTIIHRDISPHNVMISTAGEVKVTDFGIASISNEETTGSPKGKVQYMSREQLLGNSRAPAVDLFAAGAVLHELIELRLMREATDNASLYGMVLMGSIPPLEREGVPGPLAELRNALLENSSVARIRSARDALQLLYAWPGYRNGALELEALVVASRSHEGAALLKGRAAGSGPGEGFASTLLREEVDAETLTVGKLSAPPESAIATEHRPGLPESAIATEHRPGLPESAIATEHHPGLPESAIATEHHPGRPESAIATEHHTRLQPQVRTESRVRTSEVSPGTDAPTTPQRPTEARFPQLLSIMALLVLTSMLTLSSVVLYETFQRRTLLEVPVAHDAPTGEGRPEATPSEASPVPVEAAPTQAHDSAGTATDGEPERASDGHEDTSAPATKPPVSKKTKANVEVRLIAGPWSTVEVRVDRKNRHIYELDPVGDVALAPGKHTIEVRTPKSAEPWVKIGSFEVKANPEGYRVLLQKPAGLSVTPNSE